MWQDDRLNWREAKAPTFPEYDAWAKAPTPQGLRKVVDTLQPTVDQALKTYAGGSEVPTVRSRARQLAAKAVRSFDPKHGVKLQTHLMRQLQELQRVAPSTVEPLALPVKFRRDQGAIRSAMTTLTDDLGREATDEEIADATMLPLKRVLRVRGRMRARVPFSAMNADADDEDDDAPDVVASQRTPEDDWLDAVYHDLGEQDRLIMGYRTGYRNSPVLTNQEIAAKVRMHPASVSQRASIIQKKIDSFYR
jgi:DNA-directed RNA polymerase specialized sigma subunit